MQFIHIPHFLSFYHIFLVVFTVDTGGLSTGTIAGIVVGSISGVALILLTLWRKGFLGGKDIEDKGERSIT